MEAIIGAPVVVLPSDPTVNDICVFGTAKSDDATALDRSQPHVDVAVGPAAGFPGGVAGYREALQDDNEFVDHPEWGTDAFSTRAPGNSIVQAVFPAPDSAVGTVTVSGSGTEDRAVAEAMLKKLVNALRS